MATPPLAIPPTPDLTSVEAKSAAIQQMFAQGAIPIPIPGFNPTLPVTPPVQASTPAPAQEPKPETVPPAQTVPPPSQVPAEVNLEDFDFDAEPKPAAEPEGSPKPDAATTPVPPAVPATPEEITAVTHLAELLAKGDLPEQIESAMLRTNRGKLMLQAFKRDRELEQPPSADGTGGIGMRPTADQIKQWHQASASWEAMQYERQANPDSWFQNFFGPQNGQFSSSTQYLAKNFLPKLSQLDPSGQMFRSAAEPAIVSMVTDLNALANSLAPGTEPDSFGVDAKTRVLDAARILQSRLDHHMGRRSVSGPGGTVQTNGVDPLAQERAQLQRQIQSNESERASNIQSAIYSDIVSNIRSDVERVFTDKGVKSFYEGRNDVYTMLVEDAVNKTVQMVQGDRTSGIAPHNPAGLNSYLIALGSATQKGGPQSPFDPVESRRHAVEGYRQMARSVLQRQGSQFIRKAVGENNQALGPNQTTVAKLQAASQQVEPQTSGPAVQHSLVNPLKFEIQPGQDRAEAMRDYLQAKMSGGRLS